MMEEGNWGINPIGDTDNCVHRWRYNEREDAITAAKELSEKHHVEVIVFKIIGEYKPVSLWVDYEDGKDKQ